MKILHTIRYLWCCLSPNGHVIDDEEEERLSTELVTHCNRCRCPVRAWIDYSCKEDEYWIKEID